MANYKEIVTKAILGKGKKTFTTVDSITPEIVPTTILGCWVINHNFKGYKNGDKINIEGSYDINIWYSCMDDTKTEVVKKSTTYLESVVVPKRSEGDFSLAGGKPAALYSRAQEEPFRPSVGPASAGLRKSRQTAPGVPESAQKCLRGHGRGRLRISFRQKISGSDHYPRL